MIGIESNLEQYYLVHVILCNTMAVLRVRRVGFLDFLEHGTYFHTLVLPFTLTRGRRDRPGGKCSSKDARVLLEYLLRRKTLFLDV